MRLGSLAAFLPPHHRQMLRGVASYFRPEPRGTGGSDSAAYCYSVYLRHLIKAKQIGFPASPKTVAEFGPGDSLGVGLAALLCGADRYLGFDVVRHMDTETNLRVFDELVALFQARQNLNPPGEDFSKVHPTLNCYDFPADILTPQRMSTALMPSRLARIRAMLAQGDFDADDSPVRYFVPFQNPPSSLRGTVDFLLSQAVMEHVDELLEAYRLSYFLLSEEGLVSHQIDMSCHETAREWNGHWQYSRLHWRLIRGRRTWLLNRLPYSAHLALLKESGFRVVKAEPVYEVRGLPRDRLARDFRHLSEEDMTVSGAFVQALKN
jgi:hypothetical protein